MPGTAVNTKDTETRKAWLTRCSQSLEPLGTIRQPVVHDLT